MKVGVPKEIKTNQYRVNLTLGAVREYLAADHWGWSRPRLASASAQQTNTGFPVRAIFNRDLMLELQRMSMIELGAIEDDKSVKTIPELPAGASTSERKRGAAL
ncbi:hypothetical protein ACFDRK_36430 [Bradyrhizobium sp. 1AS2L]